MCTPGKLNNMASHGGDRIYDLWNSRIGSRPMLCQVSCAVRSVRVCDISELRVDNFNLPTRHDKSHPIL